MLLWLITYAGYNNLKSGGQGRLQLPELCYHVVFKGGPLTVKDLSLTQNSAPNMSWRILISLIASKVT